MFNEAELEKMVYETIAKNGWKYIPAEQLPRVHSDVLVEPMVKSALIRLNPEIAEEPSRADEVIYKFIKKQDAATRLIALSDLYHLYVPSQMSVEIYSKLYLALLRSLQKKHTTLATQQQNQNFLPS